MCILPGNILPSGKLRPDSPFGEGTFKPHGNCSHCDMGGFKQAFLVDRSHRNNMESFKKNTYKIRTKMFIE